MELRGTAKFSRLTLKGISDGLFLFFSKGENKEIERGFLIKGKKEEERGEKERVICIFASVSLYYLFFQNVCIIFFNLLFTKSFSWVFVHAFVQPLSQLACAILHVQILICIALLCVKKEIRPRFYG